MKILYLTTAVIALAAIIFCAGCLTDTEVETTNTEMPHNMYNALDELGADLSALEHLVVSDLTYLSTSMESMDDGEIESLIEKYYAKQPCITAVIYYDAVHGEYISVPVFVDIDLSSYSSSITEQDFKDAGGMIVRNNVFTKYHGYQNLYYKPVYHNGVYHGYIIFVTDIYSMLYLHPSMIGKEKSYDGYICFITDKDNKILYSSIEEVIGEVVPSKGFYDGLAFIPKVESGDGACKYTSMGFYLYDSYNKSEKITGWHQIYSSHGNKYTLYLICEENLPELKTENIFTLKTEQAIKDIRSAYVCASTYGLERLMKTIADGEYESYIYVIDMKGNVISSSDARAKGMNFLNTRGMYGVSYVEAAIQTAEQGSGYIYYLTPVERVVSPRASEYTLGIVMSVTDQYFIYTKFPGSTDAVMSDKNIRPDITRLSHAILEDVSENGVQEVCDVINANIENAPDMFVHDIKSEIVDIGIFDVKGNVYASTAFNELVGQSATFFTDVYGGSATRRMDILAKTGGGYMSQLYSNSEKEGYVDLWYAVVEPIDSNYYIYVASVVGTFEDVLTPYITT